MRLGQSTTRQGTTRESLVRGSEKWIVRFLLSDRGHRSVPGTNECLWWQRKNLLAHFLPRQIPRLIAGANRASNDRIADDCNVRSIFRPCANNISCAFFRMTGSWAIGNSQAAEM